MNIEIYTQIKDRILYMDYKPGEILNEKSLAEEFGVSRTPLREILTRLEWEKLVRVLPRLWPGAINTIEVEHGYR